MTRIKEVFSLLRLLIPLIAIFFGIFIWLEGFKIFFKGNESRTFVVEFALCSFWLFTLCYLFIKFKRIKFESKILVFFIALSVSLEFYVIINYNWFSEFCWFYPLSLTDISLIIFSNILSILGVVAIVIAILSSRFQAELTYLTNLLRIKNRESLKNPRFLETCASFPVFIGIYNTFFLLFGINNINSCNTLPLNYVIIIVTPWIILMIYYIFYSFIVSLMTR